MEKKELEVFAQTYRKIEVVCKEIMNKLASKDEDHLYDYVVNSVAPKYDSLHITEDGDVEFQWIDEYKGMEFERGTIHVPQDLFINGNIDDFCEKTFQEYKWKQNPLDAPLSAEAEALIKMFEENDMLYAFLNGTEIAVNKKDEGYVLEVEQGDDEPITIECSSFENLLNAFAPIVQANRETEDDIYEIAKRLELAFDVDMEREEIMEVLGKEQISS